MTPPAALDLANWAIQLDPTAADSSLAERSLRDTLGVALAARGHRIERIVAELDDAARWATLGHVLDFDDLEVASTTHVSVVCVMATLAAGGDERAYLAGAGVMSRLGTALGWAHYASGWHVTCTAGAPAAAVAAGMSLGLSRDEIATAIVLAVPASGGVQRAFGTDAKALQVGFATSAGVRAAELAAAGASADPSAFDEWLRLVGGSAAALDYSGAAVPEGLAIKLYPCCYALQRPIVAMRELARGGIDPSDVVSVRVTTPEATVQPLIHHRPTTGLEAKFSLEYAVAAVLLDGYPNFASFADEAVSREQAQDLIRRVELVTTPGGDSLLSGEVSIEIRRSQGVPLCTSLAVPPGSPALPPDEATLRAKLAACGADVPDLIDGINWGSAAQLLRTQFDEPSKSTRVALT